MEIEIDIVQIERHPLRNSNEIIQKCTQEGIDIQSYSPLCKMPKEFLEDDILNMIASKHNKDIGQVILRWHIDTGAIPVFTTKNVNRITQYANIFDFVLLKDEINYITQLNKNYKLYLESWLCPGF